MPSITDVASLIQQLADLVKNTRTLIEAVNDGRKFLESHYPDAGKDMSELVEQVHLTIEGLAQVTGLLSGFKFSLETGGGGAPVSAAELARFNDYVIAQKKEKTRLKRNIRKLKADCERVRVLRDKLDARAGKPSWGAMFTLLGTKSKKRAAELASILSGFYADDLRMIDLISQTLKTAELALKEVEHTLAPNGLAEPYLAPEAAQILNSYALLFEETNARLDGLADQLNDVKISLQT